MPATWLMNLVNMFYGKTTKLAGLDELLPRIIDKVIRILSESKSK